MVTFMLLVFGPLLTTFPVAFTSQTLKGFINYDMVENMEFQGTDLVLMNADNRQQCLRLCWLYSDCTIVTFYPRKLRCRLTTDSPVDFHASLTQHQKAIAVDMRGASAHKPRLYGCDHRRCAANELCVPVVDMDTYKCLHLGYANCPSPPPEVPHAVQTMDGVSNVTYTCQDGYVYSGSVDVASCDQTTGLWSSIDVTCMFKDCGSPPSVNGTITTGSDTFFDATVVYTCYDGYVSQSSSPMEVMCLPNSQWTAPPQPCSLITCPNPVGVTNGSVRILDRVFVNQPPGVSVQDLELSYGSTALHTCDQGFKSPTRPDFRSECQEDGTWESTSAFTCNPVDCGRPPAVANSWSVFNSTTFQSQVAYKCVDGYENASDSSMDLTCVANGTWSGDGVTCRVVDCWTPPEETNATASYNATTYLSQVTYTCDAPAIMYELNLQSRVCQADGRWSGEEVPCIPCGNPPEVAHNSVNITRLQHFYLAEYACNDGYRRSGSDAAKVCYDSNWRGNDPLCTPISCGNPPSLSNASFTSNGTEFLSKASYSCNEGFASAHNNSTNILTCGLNGWMDDGGSKKNSDVHLLNLLECRKLDCGNPPVVDNAISEVDDDSNIQAVTYACMPGYLLTSSSNTKQCTPGGWEMTEVTCERSACGVPPNVSNALSAILIDSASNNDFIIQIASYECQDGYSLTSSSNTKRCLSGSWENISVTCERLGCGTPKDLPNTTWVFDVQGNIAAGDWTQNVAVYTCNDGYVKGEYRVECNHGNWTKYEAISCPPVDCGSPPAVIEKATVYIDSGTLYEASILYDCENGRNWTIICQSNGTWSRVGNASCTDQNDCGPPPSFPKATSSFSDPQQTTDVKYACHSGYNLKKTISSAQLSCSSGSWLGEITSVDEICEVVNCGVPPSIENAVPQYSNTTLNDYVSYQCNDGYFPVSSDHQIRMCNESGVWSGRPDFECFSSDCGEPPFITHAVRNIHGDIAIGTIISYSCEDGFEFAGNKSEITCISAMDVWDSDEIQCLELKCGVVPVVDNAKYVLQSVNGALQAAFSCNQGYSTSETTNIVTCSDASEWNGPTIQCKPEGCPDPQPVANAKFILSSKDIGGLVTYSCHEGYHHWWFASRACTQDGTWSSERVECKIIDCGKPRDIAHARKLFNQTTYGHEVRYECESGYRFTLDSKQNCDEDGLWSNHLVECVEETLPSCPEPPVTQFSTIFYNSLVEGPDYIPVVTYKCDYGYTKSVDEYNKTCSALSNFQWIPTDNAEACSVVTCGKPPNLIGNPNKNETSETFGSKVFYTCPLGFQMVGPGFKTCRANGRWSSETSECYQTNVANFCSEPPKIENTIVDIVSYTGEAVYSCMPGYAGNVVRAICDPFKGDEWYSIEEISCQSLDCGIPRNVSDAVVTVLNTTFGSRAVYECLTGYHQDGPYISICNASGYWEGPVTSPCKPIESQNDRAPCTKPIPEIPNTEGIIESTGDTQKIRYSCKKGYSQANPNSYEIACLDSGEWANHSHVVCDPAGQCATAPNIENAALHMLKDYEFGETIFIATYICDRGFIRNGTEPRDELKFLDTLCSVTEGWDSNVPSCAVVSCGELSYINETVAMVESRNGTTYGSSARLACRAPYLGNSSVAECQESGNWSQVEMTCRKDYCDQPLSIQGGELVPITIDSKAATSSWKVECFENFQFLGPSDTTVDCSLDRSTFQEKWIDNDTMDACVKTQWTNKSTPFTMEPPYDRQKYFNTISICGEGVYKRALANKGDDPLIAMRFKSYDGSLSGMRWVIHPKQSLHNLQYWSKKSKITNVLEKRIDVQNKQRLTICCNFFLFNSTFTTIRDGKFFGQISYPVPGDKTTEGFGLDWARFFRINRDIDPLDVNIIYSNL